MIKFIDIIEINKNDPLFSVMRIPNMRLVPNPYYLKIKTEFIDFCLYATIKTRSEFLVVIRTLFQNSYF
jgi:hypothetical protein